MKIEQLIIIIFFGVVCSLGFVLPIKNTIFTSFMLHSSYYHYWVNMGIFLLISPLVLRTNPTIKLGISYLVYIINRIVCIIMSNWYGDSISVGSSVIIMGLLGIGLTELFDQQKRVLIPFIIACILVLVFTVRSDLHNFLTIMTNYSFGNAKVGSMYMSHIQGIIYGFLGIKTIKIKELNNNDR